MSASATDTNAIAGPSSPRPSSPAAATETFDSPDAPWRSTKTGKRVLELKDIDQDIASLLHLAGCTIASLHPDPLTHFTDKIVDFAEEDSEDEDGADGAKKEKPDPVEMSKEEQFSKYAEAYFSTLNDIQLALRASIRHLRLARASPAPLLDPSFGTLATPNGGSVAPGGVAMNDSLRPVDERDRNKTGAADMSVRALELEKEAWQVMAKALASG